MVEFKVALMQNVLLWSIKMSVLMNFGILHMYFLMSISKKELYKSFNKVHWLYDTYIAMKSFYLRWYLKIKFA